MHLAKGKQSDMQQRLCGHGAISLAAASEIFAEEKWIFSTGGFLAISGQISECLYSQDRIGCNMIASRLYLEGKMALFESNSQCQSPQWSAFPRLAPTIITFC